MKLPEEIQIEYSVERVTKCAPGLRAIRIPDTEYRAQFTDRELPCGGIFMPTTVFRLDAETENYRYGYEQNTKTIYFSEKAPI